MNMKNGDHEEEHTIYEDEEMLSSNSEHHHQRHHKETNHQKAHRREILAHPIHIASACNHKVIPYLLQASPDSAAERDDRGRLPLQIYLESVNVTNIDVGNFSSVVPLFMNLNHRECKQMEIHLIEWGKRQDLVLLEILLRNNDQLRIILDDLTGSYSPSLSEE